MRTPYISLTPNLTPTPQQRRVTIERLESRQLLTSVVFNDFSNVSLLQVNGNAVANFNNGIDSKPVLRLTGANSFQAGSAFSKTTIRAATFSSFFTFRITDPGGSSGAEPGADGVAFVVQSVSNNVGAAGGGIGYSGISKSVGIIWDTYLNTENNDPSGNYVGIDVNGNISHSVPATYTQNVTEPFNDGKIWYGWVDYDGTTLEVRTNQTGIRPAVANVSEKLNLVSVLGQSTAYVGFTAATGDSWENHDIVNWTYNDSYSPVQSTVTGTVFADLNKNGKQDTGESGIAGATVYVDANKNGKLDGGETKTVTNSTGNYTLSNLAAGTYEIREALPTGYSLVAPSLGYESVTLAADQTVTGQSFADAPLATITAKAPAAQTATVGVIKSITLGSFTETNATGPYTATVAWGDGSSSTIKLTAAVTIPATAHTYAKAATDTVSVTIADAAGDKSNTATFKVTVTPLLGSISGKVFDDGNGNGIRDVSLGEAGLGLFTVFVDTNNNGKLDSGEKSVVTDVLGNWSFTGLVAGTYTIRVVPVTGLSATKPTGGVATIKLTAGQSSINNLFGEKAIA